MTMTTRERAERAVARCRELAKITDVAGETTRTFLSPAMLRANEMVAGWMMRAGMALRMDAAGNVRGVLGRRGREDGPRFVMGSHLDTVVNAGAFDGPLGVMAAIEVAESLGPKALPFLLEVIGFSEEEGVRFGTPFLGSRAVVGRLDESVLALKDRDGVTVAEAIREAGLDPEGVGEARLGTGTFGYLEIHLEQGPVLEQEGRAVAGVSGIAGQTRLAVRFEGKANHAGTTPMHLRRDAMVAAAEWVIEVEKLACGEDGLVATVGAMTAEPGLGNVVPGIVTALLDVRHAQDEVRTGAVQRLLELAQATGTPRRIGVRHEVKLDQGAVSLDGRLTHLLGESALACGLMGAPVVSGAGHDAMIVAGQVPAAMLFVRTPGGVSHHPEEEVLVEDVEAALRVAIDFLSKLEPGAEHA